MIRQVYLVVGALLRKQERGQTMVEYGLILGLITVVGFVGVMLLGGGVTALYTLINSVADYLQGTSPS